MKHNKQKEFIISAWISPLAGSNGKKDYINDYNYKLIKECGLNCIYGFSEKPGSGDIVRALNCAENAGIYYMVYDRRFFQEDTDLQKMREYLSEYMDKKAFMGVLVVDEPGIIAFEKIARLHAIMKKIIPDKIFYVNMLPMYATSKQLLNGWWTEEDSCTTDDYETYVRKFTDIVKPEIISYDYYPFIGELNDCLPTYFTQLSIVRKNALRINSPFWVFIQVTSFKKGVIRKMTQAEILWQVNSSIAFGATGIQYFTYWTPQDSDSECFDLAIVDREGNPQPCYYWIKELNQHIKSLKALIGCENKGIIQCGSSLAPIPDECKIDRYGMLEGASGKHTLIGFFANKNGNGIYYIMNNSLMEKESCTLIFNKSMDFIIVRKGRKETIQGNELMLDLDIGEGVLVIPQQGANDT